MHGTQKVMAFFLAIVALLAISAPDAHCLSGIPAEQDFTIEGDYLYVLPRSGLIHKIKKDSGHVEWKSQFMLDEPDFDEPMPGSGGSYKGAVVVGNHLYAIAEYSIELFALDCGTGRFVFKQPYSHSCMYPSIFGGNLVCGELVITFGDDWVAATSTIDKEVKWKFFCEDGDMGTLFSYFQIGNSLCLFVAHPPDGSTWDEVYNSPWLWRHELIELSCPTGEVLNRYDKKDFFGDKPLKNWQVVDIAEWQGSMLLGVKYSLDSETENYTLYAFDPTSASVTMLVDRLDDPNPSKKVWMDRHYLKPLVLGNMVFYQLGDPLNIFLIGRSLSSSEILLNVKTRKGEELHAAAKGKLYGLIYGRRHFTIVCRDAATGRISWKRKMRRNALDRYTFTAEIGIKVSEGRLYFLSRNYLRALDTADGKMLWEVPLELQEAAADQSNEGLWSRILGFFD